METNTPTEQNAQAQCAECRRTFSANDMIRHGSVYVCATCKPIFLQKLAEGAEIRTGVKYAGFWIRFAARFLDSLIIGAVNFGIQIAILAFLASDSSRPSMLPLLLTYLASLTVACLYEGILVGKYGVTVGKLACKIKVVKADNTPVSMGLAFGRYFATWLSTLTLLIGYIIAAFDSEKRALHDRVCNTRVVYGS